MSGQAEVEDAGADLFDDYWEMAVANGVDPDHPALQPVRRSDALSNEDY